MKYRLVDEALLETLESPAERERFLFLEDHHEFPGFWKVNCFDPAFFFDLQEIIGSYRAVAPADLEGFLEEADKLGYEVAFFKDPVSIFDAYEALNDPPPFEINSVFEDTIGGFLPFQLQGFNFLKDLPAGVAMWDTGTGKTVVASAITKYRLQKQDTDYIWFVAKAHNKTNTQRALKRLVDIDSLVVQGKRERRIAWYDEIAAGNTPPVTILNYEQFRDDHDLIVPFFEETRVFAVWDEMPNKLRSRDSALYKRLCETLYVTKKERKPTTRVASAISRPKALHELMLSATPIESHPENWFNCVRILDPSIYGSVSAFRGQYVASYNWFNRRKPERWHKLDKMGMKAARIVHQVDKSNPDIAKYFPEALEIPVYIDWGSNRAIYDKLAKAADDEEVNPLALMTVLQMFCDAPSLLTDSAALYEAWENALEAWEEGDQPKQKGSLTAIELVEQLGVEKFTNAGHTKLDSLYEHVVEKHPDEKICVFAALKTGLITPGQDERGVLAECFEEWNVPYVVYNGTEKQKQAAEDAFMSDPKIRVFLSSDMGSDSLNLHEGSVVIDYDLPYEWARKIQRHNRIHRVTSKYATVRYYTFMMANSMEERKQEIIEQKKAYHDGVFKGGIASKSVSARMTKQEMLYVLTGGQ
jgi:hypothetical protein